MRRRFQWRFRWRFRRGRRMPARTIGRVGGGARGAATYVPDDGSISSRPAESPSPEGVQANDAMWPIGLGGFLASESSASTCNPDMDAGAVPFILTPAGSGGRLTASSTGPCRAPRAWRTPHGGAIGE